MHYIYNDIDHQKILKLKFSFLNLNPIGILKFRRF